MAKEMSRCMLFVRKKKKKKEREKRGEVSRGRLGKNIIVKFNLIHEGKRIFTGPLSSGL